MKKNYYINNSIKPKISNNFGNFYIDNYQTKKSYLFKKVFNLEALIL